MVKKNLSKTKKELESKSHSTVESKKPLSDNDITSEKSFIWGIVLLMGVIAIVQIYTSFDNKKKDSEAKITELEGQVRKLKNDYDSQAGTTEPTKVQYQVQDSDPITICKNDKCGDREMRKSLCESYTCCQVGGDWKWVESQTLCYQMQKDYREKEEEKKEQEEKYDEAKYKLDKFIECLDNQEAYYQECVGRCIDTWGENESDINFINCRGSCLESKIRLKEDLCTKYESN